jgi:HK97 family phage major capsid protein
MADPITRTSGFTLPEEVSAEIWSKTIDDSAVMQLARQVQLPGNGVAIPVITGDPDPAWVTEGGKKANSNATTDKKILTPYKLAVIETFSMEFQRDLPALYNALVERLPKALGAKFDNTVFGGTAKPGDNFDQLSDATGVSLGSDVYGALVSADSAISEEGYIVNGYAISPQARAKLLAAVDGNKRPLFVNNAAEGAIPMILGAPSYMARGAYVAGSPATLGFVGDWTQAVYGTVEGVRIDFSDQATVGGVSLWEDNLVAVRAEIELGFACQKDAFAKITE